MTSMMQIDENVLDFALGIHFWFMAFLIYKTIPPKKGETKIGPLIFMMSFVFIGAMYLRASL